MPNVVVDRLFVRDKSTQPTLTIYGNPDYAKGYDLVILDECAVGVSDQITSEVMTKGHCANVMKGKSDRCSA